MPSRTLTAGQARRIAIAAQQLADPPRPPGAAANRGHLRRLLDAIGLLQIDSVNVLARAHYLPVFARLGPYPMALVDSAAWPVRPGDRMLLETWAHVASFVPMTMEPLLRWRRRRGEIPWLDTHAALADDVLAVIRERGPCSAGQVEKVLVAPGRRKAGWWEWSHTKRACEMLFADGVLGTAHRRGFERSYDLMERIVPPQVRNLPTPPEAAAKRTLVERAARHHGIGTVRDLADYYRLPVADTAAALRELTEVGAVTPVTVRGWSRPAFLHRDARIPRRVSGEALLCPFDPLIWERDRTERLWGVHYRIEIYTPAPRRVYGYYVFLLLLGEQIAGRFDLKADRAGARLLVRAAWCEPGSDPAAVAAAAARQLARMAGWLGLADIVIAPRGNLAGELAAAVG